MRLSFVQKPPGGPIWPFWSQQQNSISVIPDWVCEVLSPQTARLNRVKKMPQYAEHGVKFLWLVDPNLLTLEAYRLEDRRWTLLGSYAENDRVRVEPFLEMPISLEKLWLDSFRG